MMTRYLTLCQPLTAPSFANVILLDIRWDTTFNYPVNCPGFSDAQPCSVGVGVA